MKISIAEMYFDVNSESENQNLNLFMAYTTMKEIVAPISIPLKPYTVSGHIIPINPPIKIKRSVKSIELKKNLKAWGLLFCPLILAIHKIKIITKVILGRNILKVVSPQELKDLSTPPKSRAITSTISLSVQVDKNLSATYSPGKLRAIIK